MKIDNEYEPGNYATFGDKLRTYIKRKGITQIKAAEKLGMSHIVLSQYIRSCRMPGGHVLKNLYDNGYDINLLLEDNTMEDFERKLEIKMVKEQLRELEYNL